VLSVEQQKRRQRKMAKIISNLFVEKYRPQTVKDIVLPKEFAKYFNNIVKTRRTTKLTIV
jgi:hypothetical protein